MIYARYMASGLKYVWHNNEGTPKVVIVAVVGMYLILLPLFIAMPSYRQQVREWRDSAK